MAELQSARQADEQAPTASSSDTVTKSDSAVPYPTRAPQTRSEIERALDLVRRERENLVARIGDAEPTEDQRERLHDLATLIRALEDKLQTAQRCTSPPILPCAPISAKSNYFLALSSTWPDSSRRSFERAFMARQPLRPLPLHSYWCGGASWFRSVPCLLGEEWDNYYQPERKRVRQH